MKILTVFGTRPEAIKLAPVIKAMANRREILPRICVTAQHRQMLDQVLQVFQITPDWDLNIMQEDQSLFGLTALTLKELAHVLKKEDPDIVLVQGDTTTAFVASLAAYYLKIRVGHVEAGLRTHDKFGPFPEEINRKLIDALCDLCFAPTKRARENLLKEGVPEARITVTGNTVIDALLFLSRRQASPSCQEKLRETFEKTTGISLDERRIILVTSHRRESFGEAFENICHGLKAIAERNEDVQVVYPVHLNPNVREPVYRILDNIKNVHLIEPLDYSLFVFLMNRAYLILTDSGGIQEEAPSLSKPVLVMRELTERPEAIEAGTAKLVGTDSDRIFAETSTLLDDESEYEKMAKATNPFGDGRAASRIVNRLVEGL